MPMSIVLNNATGKSESHDSSSKLDNALEKTYLIYAYIIY